MPSEEEEPRPDTTDSDTDPDAMPSTSTPAIPTSIFHVEIDLKEKEINHEVREQYQLQKIIEPLKKELAGIREVQLELKQATDDQLNAETRYKELLKERDMLQEKIKIQKKQEEENLMQQELEAASPSKKDKKKKKK